MVVFPKGNNVRDCKAKVCALECHFTFDLEFYALWWNANTTDINSGIGNSTGIGDILCGLNDVKLIIDPILTLWLDLSDSDPECLIRYSVSDQSMEPMWLSPFWSYSDPRGDDWIWHWEDKSHPAKWISFEAKQAAHFASKSDQLQFWWIRHGL